MTGNSATGQQFWKYVREYLTVHLPKIRCCSVHTVDSYRRSIRMYCDFLKAQHRIKFANVSWDYFARDSVIKYIQWLRRRPCAVATCNLRLSALKAFLRYCADEDVSLYSVFQEVNKIPLLKMARTPVGYLSQTALMAVLGQPDMTTVKGRRNRMIMILLYDTGVRVQELVDLRVSDLLLQAGTPFVLVTGKGNKTRSVPLMAKTVVHLIYGNSMLVLTTATRCHCSFRSARGGHTCYPPMRSAYWSRNTAKAHARDALRCRRECTLICFDIAVRCISISAGCRFPILRNSWDMQA